MADKPARRTWASRVLKEDCSPASRVSTRNGSPLVKKQSTGGGIKKLLMKGNTRSTPYTSSTLPVVTPKTKRLLKNNEVCTQTSTTASKSSHDVSVASGTRSSSLRSKDDSLPSHITSRTARMRATSQSSTLAKDLKSSFDNASKTGLAWYIECSQSKNKGISSKQSAALDLKVELKVDQAAYNKPSTTKGKVPKAVLAAAEASPLFRSSISPPKPDMDRNTLFCSKCDRDISACCGGKAMTTKCGHIFCYNCIGMSYIQNKKCPTCKRNIRSSIELNPIYLN